MSRIKIIITAVLAAVMMLTACNQPIKQVEKRENSSDMREFLEKEIEESKEAEGENTPEPTVENAPEPTPEATPEPTVEVTPEPDPEVTSEPVQENISTETEQSEETVYVGKTGTKYHEQGCRTLKNGAYPITLEEALEEGREACKVCGG